ncbi:hypothetical protein [Streptomyces sp. 142MFCol3.1]|uniref:hypothetical protein n=1 Tax=Streptomyces sp. 142MFCol3.1 TaxID=1172179 RepID=UPI00042A28F8|nr:hypothetical protein [Streptomyces sp. 142MFCol3.1]
MTASLDALDPVRAELLRAARSSADAVLERARAEAEETLRTARGTAAEVRARARARGEADGAAGAAQERVRALQDAWALELVTRSEVYAELRTAVRAGVRRALAEGGATTGRLTKTAQALLGSRARVTSVAEGGVTAEVPGRRLDLSADALADRALERLGARAERLWRPP